MASNITRGIHRIFVSNLSWTIGQRELLDYFTQFGGINSAKVVFDRSTGMSRGYGFVDFTARNSFDNALNKKDHLLEGNFLHVQPAST